MQENKEAFGEQLENIDLNFVIKEVSGSSEFIVDLLETFDSALEEYIAQLLLNIHSKDITSLSITVHKLKPSLKMFSLNQSLDCVYTIESNIRHQLPEEELLVIVDSLAKKLAIARSQLASIILLYQAKIEAEHSGDSV